jgi:ubiquinone/menaquinone biosynthesis C-methylase UbiE
MSTGPDETARVRAIWDRLAPTYDRSAGFEARLLGDGRAWVIGQATGDVLEIAVGTGRNLPLYPAGTRLTAVDISPRMLAIADARARAVGLEAELVLGDAQRLSYPDASFDTVVCTLALCSIPDDRAAVSEAYRVLRPGGRFVLIEHVRSHHRVIRGLERLMERWSLPRTGDHLLRDPLDHLEAVGFVVDQSVRSRLGFIERVLAHRP